MAKRTVKVGQILNLKEDAPSNLLKMWGLGPFIVEQILDGGITFQLRGRVSFLASRYQVQRFMEDCPLRLVKPDISA